MSNFYPLENWSACAPPERVTLTGRLCRLEPLTLDHAADLHSAYRVPGGDAGWDYLAYGPYESLDAFQAAMPEIFLKDEPLFYAVIDLSVGKAVGVLSFQRIRPGDGSIEIGHIHFSQQMQGTAMSTEVQYLLMRYAMTDLGYRRLEWRCNAANEPSKAAAVRLGYRYEGTFRKDRVVNGWSRDTTWFSILDDEWPSIKASLEAWLDPANFDARGMQIKRLQDC